MTRDVEKDATEDMNCPTLKFDIHQTIKQENYLRNGNIPEDQELLNQMVALSYHSAMHKEEEADIAKIMMPACYFENWTGACCINLEKALLPSIRRPVKVCLETALKLNHLKANAVLHINGKELQAKEFGVGRICWDEVPPPFTNFGACLWVYKMEVNDNQNSFIICSVLELTRFLHFDFNCLRFRNGTFSMLEEIQPMDNGLVNLSLIGGKLRFREDSPKKSPSGKYWYNKDWDDFERLFRKKSVIFEEWIRASKEKMDFLYKRQVENSLDYNLDYQ